MAHQFFQAGLHLPPDAVPKIKLSARAEMMFLEAMGELDRRYFWREFSPLYELAVCHLFPFVYGKLPCDVPQFGRLLKTINPLPKDKSS